MSRINMDIIISPGFGAKSIPHSGCLLLSVFFGLMLKMLEIFYVPNLVTSVRLYIIYSKIYVTAG